MRTPTLSFLIVFIFLYYTLVHISTTNARAFPRVAAVDRYTQNNVQEFLHTASIFGDAKRKFLDIIHRGAEKVNFDFWKEAEFLGTKFQKYSETLLEDAKSQVNTASESIEEARRTVHSLVTAANHLHSDLVSHAGNEVSAESLSEDLDKALAPILDKFHERFPAPDEAPHHDERESAVHELLDRIEENIVEVGTQHGLGEASLRHHIEIINPLILKLVLLIGDLSEQHPILRDMLIFTVVAIIIPESWILRPILRLFGFGPEGPMKGSVASGAQRYFYGAAVKKGSWFSNLQRAGMKVVPPGTGKKVVGGIGAGVGLALSLYRC